MVQGYSQKIATKHKKNPKYFGDSHFLINFVP